MITIFNGRKLSLDGTEDAVYAEVSVALRDKIHCFNTGKTCNPFAVFMAIALHSNQDGWAWPGRSLLSKETGIKDAIGTSIKHLCKMRIEGHRVLTCYRERRTDGTWGRTLYRIFPDAWGEYAIWPEKFKGSEIHDWDPNDGEPAPHNPPLDCPGPDNAPYKENQIAEEEPVEKHGADAQGADALFYGTSEPPPENPAQEQVERMRTKFGNDPLSVSATAERARQEQTLRTVPEDAEAQASIKEPAIQEFKRATGYYPPKPWRAEIVKRVGREGADVERWYDTCYNWVGCGWNPRNAKGMLDFFILGEIPSTDGGTSNPEPTGWSAYAELMKERHGEEWAVGFAR